MLAVLSQNIVLCCRRVWFGNQRIDTPIKICSVCRLQVCILNELITAPCSCQGHLSFWSPWCRIPESGEKYPLLMQYNCKVCAPVPCSLASILNAT